MCVYACVTSSKWQHWATCSWFSITDDISSGYKTPTAAHIAKHACEAKRQNCTKSVNPTLAIVRQTEDQTNACMCMCDIGLHDTFLHPYLFSAIWFFRISWLHSTYRLRAAYACSFMYEMRIYFQINKSTISEGVLVCKKSLDVPYIHYTHLFCVLWQTNIWLSLVSPVGLNLWKTPAKTKHFEFVGLESTISM